MGPDHNALARKRKIANRTNQVRHPYPGAGKEDNGIEVIPAFAAGETVVSDITDGLGPGRDVFSALAHGLEMLGAHVGDYADGIVIKGGQELRGNLVDSCLSPGIALALAVAGLNSSGTTTVFGFEEDAFPVNEFMRIIKELS